MTTDFRALCARMADELDHYRQLLLDDRSVTHRLADEARAADLLAQRQPQPVPVSERLPGPGDCDAEGNVWSWRRFDSEGDIDNGDFWCLAFYEWLEDDDCGFTHWLPASALPLPQPS